LLDYLLATLVGLLAGFIGTLLGIGGGAIMVPAMVLLGFDVKVAVPASLVAVLGTSAGGLRYLFSRGLVSWRIAVPLELASISGSLLGVEVFRRASSRAIVAMLGVVLVVLGFAFTLRGRRVVGSSSRPGRFRQSLAIVLSFVAGMVSAMFGIGGGVVKVPMLVFVLGMPLHAAVATSKLMIGLTALAGVAGHALKEAIDWALALSLLAGTYTGATLSSRLLVRVKPRPLYYLASAYYYVMGAYMALKALLGL
jgi:uncharacterized membrane protein YfcA